MRTISIIQPSFLPWRGYFSIIAQSDCFVFYDDVQYDRRGWRNRNQIKTSQGPQWIVVPVSKSDHLEKIVRIRISNESPWQKKLLTAVKCAYGKTPYFDDYYPWLEKRLNEPWELLVDLDIALTKDVCGFLSIPVEFARSSELPLSANADRINRLVEICRYLKADRYLSGPSARDYIGDSPAFEQAGIELKYAGYHFQPYPQLFGDFVGEVSIIDTLFNQGPAAQDYLRGLSMDPAKPLNGVLSV